MMLPPVTNDMNMMAHADYSAIVDEFEQLVRKHFIYLETNYGFTACTCRLQNLDEPRDATVSIRYKSDTVSLQIGLSLVGAGIGVTFKNEKWIDIPKNQRVKCISLDAVVAFRTNGTAKTLLHELTSSRHKHWPEGFLLTNMGLAIETIAVRVKQYATDIIGGNVLSFPEIAATYRE